MLTPSHHKTYDLNKTRVGMSRPALFLACLLLLSGCSGTPSTTDSAPDVSTVNGSIEQPNLPWPFLGHHTWPDIGPSYVVGEPSTAQFEGVVTAYVWNADSQSRTFDVSLSYGPDETIHEESVRLSANETLGLRLGQSGEYVLTVDYGGESGEKRITVDPSDCNTKAHVLWVDRSGEIDDSIVSTSMGCERSGN